MINQISVSRILSLSIQLAGAACEIVQNYYVNQNAKQYSKGVDDFVTEADYKVQSMVIKGLKHYYPELRIVGEEDKQFQGEIEIDYSKFGNNIISEEFGLDRFCANEELCVWIDPIDCTKGFINGEIQDVTVLIGISQKKQAEFGIIGIPYKMVNGKSLYDPSVIFGSASDKVAYQYSINSGKFVKVPYSTVEKSQVPVVVTSSNRKASLEVGLIQKLGAKHLKCGGSGHKIAMVLNEGTDLTIYPLSFTSKWDTCAGHAIIKAVNGYFTDCYGGQILYNPENPKQSNDKGFICTLEKQIHEKALNFFIENKMSHL